MTEAASTRATSSTFARYLRFQAPGVIVLAAALAAAIRFELVGASMAGGFLLLWIAKDLALYPLLKRAYEPTGHGYPSRLVGKLARAREDLAPRGYVGVGGELWRAEARGEDVPIRAGETVVITGAVGTRLLVRRAQGAEVERST
jgi:membrane protein implicated in regulation of membrane protease activity